MGPVVDHTLAMKRDGSVFCTTHERAADLCIARREGNRVFETTIDRGSYAIEVTRTGPYCGVLSVSRGGTIVIRRAVLIRFDAPYGPDAKDVREWLHFVTHFADQYNADQGNRSGRE